MTPLRADIAVCTFRREALDDTLASLARLIVPEGVHLRIIVADNDAEPSARERVDAAQTAMPVELVYVHCPAGNISIARNACLDAADADFLAFVDDDETVEPLWLDRLLAEAETSGADVVLGPVQAVYAPEAPGWMRHGYFHSTHPVWVKGEIRTGYTCNVLMRLAAASIAGRRFDLALGRSGGEDTAFFDQVHAAGGRIAFAKDAWVREPVPASRARFSWLAQRRLRMGQTHGRILAERHEGAARWAAAVLATTKCTACFAAALALALLPARRNRFLLRGLLHAGAIAGLFGARTIEPYGKLEAVR
ncbi:glycosyltransferase family 2 protein [Sinorhizobium sp. RAC02]|uniref:glycosyltransferase n=1 Tax=Sinorhizobium sp. RAC02 TaxID=1842534 RepID=UPI00083CF330|nr:glycosyltransferase family 2 protein [Sinorhizobium sp. RAC02]AOF93803.1 glycosyl transferase 21 family protein [Sinorhizobium sp. RAC02]